MGKSMITDLWPASSCLQRWDNAASLYKNASCEAFSLYIGNSRWTHSRRSIVKSLSRLLVMLVIDVQNSKWIAQDLDYITEWRLAMRNPFDR